MQGGSTHVTESLAATSSVYHVNATSNRSVPVLPKRITKLAPSANLPDAEKSAAVHSYEE